MAEEDDWNARLLFGDQAVQGPQVADDLVPSALVGEMAEIGRRSLGPVAAMIVGVNGVAGGVERRGETRVAGAVLGEAMGDLDDRPRAPLGKPTPRQEVLAIVGAKVELAPSFAAAHLRALSAIPLEISLIRSRVKPVGRIAAGKFLLAESIGIG